MQAAAPRCLAAPRRVVEPPQMSGVFFVIGGRSVRAMERPSDFRDRVSRSSLTRPSGGDSRKKEKAERQKEADHDEDQHAYNRACRHACGVRAGDTELRATQRRDEQQPRASAEELQHRGWEI